MCTQSVGLVAGALEAVGIATVAIALVRSVARKVRPPRALAVPFPFGQPLGPAAAADVRLDVVRQAVALLREPGPGPILRDYRPAQPVS
jgi:hypothetical protein